MTRYAEMLEGRVLPNGWTIGPLITPAPGQTGGKFSASYLVATADGRTGFLKAIDLSSAFSEPDLTAALEPLLEAYNFERNLLFECNSRRMDRVVQLLDYGTITVDATQAISRVPYLVFERGAGDIRVHLAQLGWVDVAWAMRALHHISVGIKQLHAADVAHQDLKPSNVVLVNGVKVGDLGHAVRRGQPPTRPEHAVIGGDPAHAPPEQLYGAAPADWVWHRFGSDIYHLGSMIVFMFARTNMTALLLLQIPPAQRPEAWRGTYGDLLPLIRDAFDRAMVSLAAEVPESIRADIVGAVRQLCDPDPTRRGHPRARAMRHGNPLSLEQYVSLFNSLAARVERSLRIKTT